VRQLERAVRLGREAGNAQREVQRVLEEEEERIDEPEEGTQELYLEESPEEGSREEVFRRLSVQDISSEDLNHYVR